jgi:hypothetical protein
LSSSVLHTAQSLIDAVASWKDSLADVIIDEEFVKAIEAIIDSYVKDGIHH